MNHRMAACLTLLLLTLTMPCWAKIHSANLRQTLQALYNKQDRAFAHKDSQGALSIYDPDYVEYETNGDQIDILDLTDNLQKAFDVARIFTIRATIQSVKPQYGGAIVMVHTYGKLVVDDDSTGRSDTLVINETDRDFWIKGPDGWKLRQERALRVHPMLNGKPVK